MPSNPNQVLGETGARHLLKRCGFGGTPTDIGVYSPLTRDQAAEKLLAFTVKPKNFKPSGRDTEDAHNKWVKYLVNSKTPMQEKLVLFWHDHFATANTKVGYVKAMGVQIKTLYLNCAGNMKTLVKLINKDPAMVEFLDTVRNFKEVPNENYARELQELFTLGVFDLLGQPNYTQDDIVQIARAFTGWSYDRRKLLSFLNTDDHDVAADWPDRGLPIGAPNPPGNKKIYQQTGGFGPGGADYAQNGEGAAEIDTVIDIIFQHRDSEGKNTVARRTAKRLLEYLAHPNPALALVDEVVADSSFDSTFSIRALVKAIIWNDAFYDTAAPAPFTAATKKSVMWPIDFVVSTLRLFKMKPGGRNADIGNSGNNIFDALSQMGQTLLDPPSVFGWDWETSWISSASLLARYEFARDVIAARQASQFKPVKFINLALTDPGQIVDAALTFCGVQDQLTSTERQALVDYASDGGTVTSLDLTDYDTRNRKLHGLFGLILQSAAYQMH